MQGVRASQGKAFNQPTVHIQAWFIKFISFLGAQLSLQRPEAFLWSPVFIAFGILGYFALPFEPHMALAIAVLVLPSLVLAVLPKESVARLCVSAVLLVALGFAAGTFRTASVYTPILEKKIKFANVSGYIDTVEQLSGSNSYRVVIGNPKIEDMKPKDTPRKIRVKLRHDSAPRPGQYVELLAGLNPSSSPVIPGGFDFRKYMYFQGIGAVGFSYGAPKILHGEGASTFQQVINRARNDIVTKLTENDERYGSVAAALLVGHRQAIYEEDNEALRSAGLAHMLAISGLHIGLFFGVVFFAVRIGMAGFPGLALRYPIKNYAAVAAITAAAFYMMFAGATIPTQRAMMMMSLVFLAILINRTAFSMRLVAFAALLVLLTAPESLISPSFQMSFAAVTALVAFYRAIKPFWSTWHAQASWPRKLCLYVLGVMMTSLVASLATAPFALYHFHRFALLGVVANLLAMPVLAFVVMPMAVIYFIALPLDLGALVLPIMLAGIGFIIDTAHMVSSLDFATIHFRSWPAEYLALYALAFVVLMVGVGKIRYVAAPLFAVFVVLVSAVPRPDILVSDDSELLAIKAEGGGYVFSTLRKGRFVREQWTEALALKDEQIIKWDEVEELSCDEHACRVDVEGQKISVVYSPAVFLAECGWADLLISDRPLPYCASGQVIDRFDTYARGAAAVYVEGGDLKITYAVDKQVRRPWLPE